MKRYIAVTILLFHAILQGCESSCVENFESIRVSEVHFDGNRGYIVLELEKGIRFRSADELPSGNFGVSGWEYGMAREVYHNRKGEPFHLDSQFETIDHIYYQLNIEIYYQDGRQYLNFPDLMQRFILKEVERAKFRIFYVGENLNNYCEYSQLQTELIEIAI